MTLSPSDDLLAHAVYGHRDADRPAPLLDRLFAFWFRRLVYTQIWEDPAIDMAALALRPGERVLSIASAGCNAIAYLTEDPASVTAVDLNPAHLALARLKAGVIAAAPDHDALIRFFGTADDSRNVAWFDREIAARLDPETRSWWQARDWRGRRRIQFFARGFFAHGLLGRSIGLLHLLAGALRVDLAAGLRQPDVAAQAAWFEQNIAPVFANRFVQWLCRSPLVVYNLGIPPAQYQALCEGRPERMADVLCDRVRRLATTGPSAENYFAWQAFGRRYPVEGGDQGLPPYLQARHFAGIKARIGRVDFRHATLRGHLETQPASSLDAYVLLDAQDWMTPAELCALWTEIRRTARPGARVVFRTAGAASPVDRALAPADLGEWQKDERLGADLHGRDRSGIYGGFHIYRLPA